MNANLYKRVRQLAVDLLSAAEASKEADFKRLYQELKAICDDNQADDHKNHPVQWETLADFTEDADTALKIYTKALNLAVIREAVDYQASIHFSMAQLYFEMTQFDHATQHANEAKTLCEHINDPELLRETHALIKAIAKAHKKPKA